MNLLANEIVSLLQDSLFYYHHIVKILVRNKYQLADTLINHHLSHWQI